VRATVRITTEPDVADALAVTALDLARHFASGATLWCAAPRWPEHARHLAVEFVHPVVVGSRALPAVGIESPDLLAALRAQVRRGDVLTLLSDGDDPIAHEALRQARACGVTSIWLRAGESSADVPADHVVCVTAGDSAGSPAEDGRLALCFHVLWELTHVCFEHPGLLGSEPTGAGDAADAGDAAAPSAFLYPFLDSRERGSDALLVDLAESARGKAQRSASLRTETLSRCAGELATIAAAVADRFAEGGRLFVFGNGGSATDAAGMARLLATPPWGQPLPARALVDDPAVLTAIGNDVGFDLIFARQLIALGRRGDVAVALSTSGSSRNVLSALAEADRGGMTTIGIAGYAGGEMVVDERVHHCLVVGDDSVHRIQETQAALVFGLWESVQSELAGHGARA
jgi:D-sedoheptulose 7-phosphate isomerase